MTDQLRDAEFIADAIRRELPRYEDSNFRDYMEAELTIADSRVAVIKANRRIVELGYKLKP